MSCHNYSFSAPTAPVPGHIKHLQNDSKLKHTKSNPTEVLAFNGRFSGIVTAARLAMLYFN